MKTISQFLISLVLILTFNTVSSQEKEDCKVKGSELKGTYEGKCKKGLAHGLGVFKYSKVDNIYEGRFKKGMMNGEGIVYTMSNGTKEIVKKGIWKKNKYVGEKPVKPYRIERLLNVERNTVKKISEIGNKVTFNFLQNGSRNGIRNLTMTGFSGTRIVDSYYEGYENVQFPFRCIVKYVTYNRFRTASYEARYEITIFEPGSWEIGLYN